jgi:hypothetical protein
MTRLQINDAEVEVHRCRDGYWKHDSVFIYSRIISNSQVNQIMDYLFTEAFIQDRRTRYFITQPEEN